MNAPYLSIILPIYNEEKRLPMCLAHVLDYLWHYTKWCFEVICVLNGCTDGSECIAHMFYNRWAQIRIINLTRAGKGNAVRAGMLAAKGKYRYMADVDLSTPITALPDFIAPAISGADVVCGDRQIRGSGLVRRITHAGYRAMTRNLSHVRDPQCGFKLFTGECAEQVFPHVRTNGYGFDVEAIYLASQQFQIVEIPVQWEHAAGSKLHPLTDGFKMALELLEIRRHHRPMICSNAAAGSSGRSPYTAHMTERPSSGVE